MVQINGKTAKSSSEVKIGDELTLTFGEKVIRCRITDIREHVLKDDAKDLYEVI